MTDQTLTASPAALTRDLLPHTEVMFRVRLDVSSALGEDGDVCEEDRVAVVGNAAVLGLWDPAQGLLLEPDTLKSPLLSLPHAQGRLVAWPCAGP